MDEEQREQADGKEICRELVEYLEANDYPAELMDEGLQARLIVDGYAITNQPFHIYVDEDLYNSHQYAVLCTFIRTGFTESAKTKGLTLCNALNQMESAYFASMDEDGDIMVSLAVRVGYPGWKSVVFEQLQSFLKDVDGIYDTIIENAEKAARVPSVGEKCAVLAEALKANDVRCEIEDETTVALMDSGKFYSDQQFAVIFNDGNDYMPDLVQIMTTIEADFTGEARLKGLLICNEINSGLNFLTASLEDDGNICLGKAVRLSDTAWRENLLLALNSFFHSTELAFKTFTERVFS